MPDLPLELVLAVLRDAACAARYESPAWVAALCLVCKGTRSAVEQVLYHAVRLDARALELLQALPDNPCFLLTRKLWLDGVKELVGDQRAMLVRCFSNIDFLAAPFPTLADLCYLRNAAHGRPAPKSIFFVDAIGLRLQRFPTPDDFSSVTHMQLRTTSPACKFVMSSDAVRSALRCTHVLLDADTIDSAQELHFRARQLLSVPSLVRLLCRVRAYAPRLVHALQTRLESLSDPRVYLDDTTLRASTDGAPVMHGFLGEDHVWDCGRQVYHAE